MEDAQLLAQVAHGDARAFQEFYARFAVRVFRYALTLVRDRHLAEEVVQETMVAVWKGAGSFRGRSQVSTWVFGIARNHALKLLHRLPAIVEEPEEEETAGEMESLDRAERVQRAVAKLPGPEREVVVLAFYQGLSYREIAEILGIPEGTVKSRMFHAKRRLRELLGGKASDAEASPSARLPEDVGPPHVPSPSTGSGHASALAPAREIAPREGPSDRAFPPEERGMPSRGRGAGPKVQYRRCTNASAPSRGAGSAVGVERKDATVPRSGSPQAFRVPPFPLGGEGGRLGGSP